MPNPVLNERVMKDAPPRGRAAGTDQPALPARDRWDRSPVEGPREGHDGQRHDLGHRRPVRPPARFGDGRLIQTETVEIDGQEFVSGIPALAWVGMITASG
ncbi:MAG: hypothetical protein R2705_21780 [Ilumatobacteraceae bacterium]